MKAKELLVKVKEFKKLLEEYFELWKELLNSTQDYKKKNYGKLKEQQKQLHRLFYPIDDYLTKFSKGRSMYRPATGVNWDIYDTSISNDVKSIKGPSLEKATLELEGIIAVLEQRGPEEEIKVGFVSSQEKRVFISHGNETEALNKVERFLRGLGIKPIIVKREPSSGKALDDLIEEQMSSCEAVIILATKDDKVKSKKGEEYFQSRPNVIHEIGLAQEKVGEKIIYLKEKSCDFPSNIRSKVWESFTQDNMEGAFLKIAKELKAFGIIQ